ncbi:cytochrome P450 [Coprinellus micaceus]|uniref:Cytochrome P450 n=1 Tax=Coprinellus micaceus TaxID=71717 RepID=A0A4Y7TEN6_COPMI|nr:cytochrome P450 [Coprinellus micaceus]
MLQSNSLKVLATFTLAWLVWRVLKRFFLPHPLDHIPGLKPSSWIAGSLAQVFSQDGWDFHDRMADKRTSIFGTLLHRLQSEQYFAPPASSHKGVQDQQTLESSDDMLLVNEIIFGRGLLSTTGAHHRRQRKMMNPAFTTAKMRDLRRKYSPVTHVLHGPTSPPCSYATPYPIDMMDRLSRAALEFVGRGFFSTTFESFKDGYTPPYLSSVSDYARVITLPDFILPRFLFLDYIRNLGSPKFRRWVIDHLPWKNLHILRDIVDAMHGTGEALFQDHLDAFGRGEGEETDILNILMKSNNSALKEDRMSDSELLAQITTLNFAGFGTTTGSITRILDLLCRHPDAQEGLRREVISTAAKYRDGDIPYDELVSLPFLDAVIRETWRVYTPLPLIVKQVNQDTELPLSRSYPATNGALMTEIFVPRGTMFVLSLNACNRDYAIWGDDARVWKPERWLSPLPDTVIAAKIPGVFSHLMTFYGGQKACIGYKFAELEAKIVISLLLRRFRFSFSDKKIIWKMNGLNQPIIEDAELDQHGLPMLQMPLRVVPLSDA